MTDLLTIQEYKAIAASLDLPQNAFIDGTFRLGTPDEVMTTEVLSELYGSHVEVIRRSGRIIVVGAEDMHHSHHDVAEPRLPVAALR